MPPGGVRLVSRNASRELIPHAGIRSPVPQDLRHHGYGGEELLSLHLGIIHELGESRMHPWKVVNPESVRGVPSGRGGYTLAWISPGNVRSFYYGAQFDCGAPTVEAVRFSNDGSG